MAAAKKKAKPRARAAQVKPSENLGHLHKLLSEAFPRKRTSERDKFDVLWLAGKLGKTDKAVYHWFTANKLPFACARDICKLPGCKIKLEKLIPFIS